MSEIMIKGILGMLLFICSVQDVYKKKIHIWIVISCAVILCVCIPFCHTLSVIDRVLGVTAGIGVILVSKATGGKIGMGDGILLCVTGLGLGLWGNLELFAIALFAAAVLSVILLIFRKINRKKSIPFIPFLLLGYLFLMIAGRNQNV